MKSLPVAEWAGGWLKAVSCRHTLLGNRDVDKDFSHLLFSVLSHVRQPAQTTDECAKQAASPRAAGVRTDREPLNACYLIGNGQVMNLQTHNTDGLSRG